MCVCLLHCDRSSHSMGHINNRNKYKCIVELQQLLVVVVHYYTGRLFQVKWSCLTERPISQVTLIVDASSLTHMYCLFPVLHNLISNAIPIAQIIKNFFILGIWATPYICSLYECVK